MPEIRVLRILKKIFPSGGGENFFKAWRLKMERRAQPDQAQEGLKKRIGRRENGVRFLFEKGHPEIRQKRLIDNKRIINRPADDSQQKRFIA